jgi:flagellar hook-length control protein FliK
VAAPARPKDEKPAHPAAAPSSDVQADVPALPDLSSPPATQVLGAPPAPSPQSAPAPAPATNPAPDSNAVLSATLAAAAQTAPRASSADKTGNDKSTAAPDAKADSNARANGTRQLRPSTSAETAPAAPSASDRPAEPPAEHAQKSEAAPLAANLPQTNPAPSSSPAPVPAPIHATPDLSASAIANAPAASSLDVSTPVRLSFAAPTIADAPSFDALALRIASRSADGENNFAIRLDPPELGRIEVNLNVNSDGQAQASLSADKPQTLDLLQKDSSALERALKDAGINLAGGMTFSLKGDSKQAWRDMQNAPRGRNIQIAAVDAANANAAITTGAALAARAYGLPVALLDIRV